jgi:cell division protein FtsW
MLKNIVENIRGDKYIWYIVTILSFISLLLVYSSTRTLAYKSSHGNTEYFLLRHGIFLAIGMWLIYIIHRIDHRYFSRLAQLLLFLSIPLLIYTMLFGEERNEASRWVRVPIIGLTFQSSDFAKLALIMYTSRTLSKKQGVIKDFKEVSIYIMLPIIGICGLIMLDNFSTAAILFATCIVILFIGRVSTKYILSIVVAGITAAAMLFAISWFFLEGHGRADMWLNRVESWIDPDYNADDFYQQKQAFIAMAKGGIFRIAPGKSTQCNFLPDAYSDFIFSTLVEEYGLVGAAITLMLYLFFLYRIINIVVKSPRAFGALMAVGLGVSITLQAVLHMGVNAHLLPNTGITLPFISWGGTSILFNAIAIGIILSVSAYVENRETTTLVENPTNKKSKKKIVDEIHG